VYPVLGFLILAFVLYNARASAQILGIAWLVIGIIVATVLSRRGKIKDPLAESSIEDTKV